jgi:hypothetical protein
LDSQNAVLSTARAKPISQIPKLMLRKSNAANNEFVGRNL